MKTAFLVLNYFPSHHTLAANREDDSAVDLNSVGDFPETPGLCRDVDAINNVRGGINNELGVLGRWRSLREDVGRPAELPWSCFRRFSWGLGA